MYLSKLELTGFKSFARKTILTFPRLEVGRSNIAAIVGPNGSGKSNVADAIRWVTGEQSLKNLRGKKSEDIIFSGSNKSGRLGFAEVSLHIDNSDHQAPTDYSELIITRKLYRSGESEYQINGSRARLQDILLLMARLSFGQKSYSIIGQGMADAILAATPAERKDFLNEAAGIKQYQIKRDHAQAKLETTKNNLVQAETLTAEIEPHLNSLTRQVKKLERREELETKLHEHRLNYYSHRWFLILNQWNEQNAKLEKIISERQSIEENFNSLQASLSRLAKDDNVDENFSVIQKKYFALQETKNSLLHQKTILSTEIAVLSRAHLKPQDPKINEICSLNAVEANELLKILETIKCLYEKTLKEIVSGNPEDLKAIIQKIQAEINAAIKKIKKEKPISPPDLNSEKQKILQTIAEAEAKINQLEHNISKNDELLKQISAEISAANQERSQERRELFETQKQLQSAQSQLSRFTSEESNLKIELARIETHKEDLEQEIKQELGSFDLLSRACQDANPAETYHQIQGLKHQLELIGGIDPEIAKEYLETKERFEHLNTQIKDLKAAGESLDKLIKELDDIIKNRFESSFEKINQEFQKFFKTLFSGGSAKLIYTKEVITMSSSENVNSEKTIRDNSSSPVPSIVEGLEEIREKTISEEKDRTIKEGVEIEATPPGKRLKSINMLSGGERALTSIALICAIIANNPSPFVVLDEVDAALDEANSVRFAEILDSLSHKTQFIVISHNRASMEKAKILYGVTMGDDGISKLLSVKLEEIKNQN